MPLSSLFKRKDSSEPAVGADDDAAVSVARTQARRRLIGAVVLLAAGVIVFPLLFDGKPRPLPGDVKVELRRGEGAVSVAPAPTPVRPLVVPPPPPEAASEPAMVAMAPAPAPAPTTAPPRSFPAAASAPASAPGNGRFVVQVGAFTDPVALREARQKVEKLGLKTYTQVIENPDGKRTRVRVGPFETRADAEAAGAKIKAAGLPAYMLSL